MLQYYFEPSSQMRFNSRAEVFRYLKIAAISHPESEESRTVEQPENNVCQEIYPQLFLLLLLCFFNPLLIFL